MQLLNIGDECYYIRGSKVEKVIIKNLVGTKNIYYRVKGHGIVHKSRLFLESEKDLLLQKIDNIINEMKINIADLELTKNKLIQENKYCDNCLNLCTTEAEQNKKGGEHRCFFYNKILKHNGEHSKIPRPAYCNNFMENFKIKRS